ncbi:hypothetical protein IscW_ISCW014900, partial [Ixodes scapularis]
EPKREALTVIRTARGHLKHHRRLRRRWRATTTRSRSCPNSQSASTHAHTTTCNADDDENGAGRRQRRRLPSLQHDQTRESQDANGGNRRAAAFPVRLFLSNPRTWLWDPATTSAPTERGPRERAP